MGTQTKTQQARYHNAVTGPRWLDLELLIRELTQLYSDLKLTECSTEKKDLLRWTTRFSVEGSEASVRSWKRMLESSISKYND